MKYFLIAGEPSGDVLGAKLINELKAQDPEAQFIGIGGDLMIGAGMQCLLPMSELSIMGIWEVFMRLPQLLKLRNAIVEEIEKQKPEALITIDFPDFNFQVAKRLKKRKKLKIRCIHYVAPTVWAWRPGRAKAVAQYLDAMICLFPFEPQYFKKHGLRSVFVGHPIIEENASGDGRAFRERRKVPENVKLLGIFFGSRQIELKYNAEVMKETATYVSEQVDNVQLVVPTLEKLEYDIIQLVQDIGITSYVESDYSKKWDAIAACDAAIVVSGTMALELAYAGVPHVVVYKTGTLNYLLVRLLAKVKFVHLGNIILNKPIVPEFIQFRCKSEKISDEALKLLQNPEAAKKQTESFEEIRASLGVAGEEMPSVKAARYIVSLLKAPPKPKAAAGGQAKNPAPKAAQKVQKAAKPSKPSKPSKQKKAAS